MVRRSDEEKAAQNRAAWNQRAASAAAETAQQKADAQRKEAAYVARVTAEADRLSSKGKPTRFLVLGIAVMDKAVYVMKPGFPARPVLLGPLAGARAVVRRLPPKVESRFLMAVAFGGPDNRHLGRVEVTVVTSLGTHRVMVEAVAALGQSSQDEKAEEEARKFNVLASERG